MKPLRVSGFQHYISGNALARVQRASPFAPADFEAFITKGQLNSE